jgi:membrane protease YdiL (CAAX protease family)
LLGGSLAASHDGGEGATWVATGIRFAAFWAAILEYRRVRERDDDDWRFVLGLGLSALFAHAGWAALSSNPALHRPEAWLEWRSGFASVFVVLGPIVTAPARRDADHRRAYLSGALRCLPLALATARLGCIAEGCCNGALVPAPLAPLLDVALLLTLRWATIRVVFGRRPAAFVLGLLAINVANHLLRLSPTEASAAVFAAPLAVGSVALLLLPAPLLDGERRGAGSSAAAGQRRPSRRRHDLGACALCVSVVWTLVILVPGAFGGGPRSGSGLLIAYLLAALVAVSAAPGTGLAGIRGASCGVFVVALGSGVMSFPVWAAGVASISAVLGVAAPPFLAGDGASLALVLAIGFLGPLFEEVLYRGWLLDALVERVGWPSGAIASSVVFALPHGDWWNVVTAFLLGTVLATSRRLGVGLAACIGAHSGLNLAFLLRDRIAILEQPAWVAGAGVLIWALLVAGARATAPARPNA